MNGRHWTDYSEAQLAAMRAHGRVHASSGPPRVREPDVTAQTKAVLDGLRVPGLQEPAYPVEWLPELQAAQTPADWMKDNAPDPREHGNGTPPTDTPASDAYPAEWLQGFGGMGSGALGGDGWLNIRRAA